MCPVKRWALTVVLSSLLAVGGCGSDQHPSADPPAPAAAAPGGTTRAAVKVDPHYVVFPGRTPGAGWTLAESVRETGTGREAQLGGLPGVDWYTEFNGPANNGEPAYLSLTGYTESLAQRKDESVSDTSQTQDGDINGHPAFWTTDPNDPASGVTVTWAVTDTYSIEVYATGISMDELLTFARTVKDASEAEWKAAGGTVTDCSATANATPCPNSADG